MDIIKAIILNLAPIVADGYSPHQKTKQRRDMIPFASCDDVTYVVPLLLLLLWWLCRHKSVVSVANVIVVVVAILFFNYSFCCHIF